ncbi:hypothetical protein GDO78_011134 [Eleutherodactylus coqui]|uniref:Uncharacterized protein n=1 Tax=Eleutherodactylus coqui TaxID=57060 RepID=A0A8J6F8Z2_ELECQ|nr:hypothetical protein GDO78_011134 [Eleutherodactylus coqui]
MVMHETAVQKVLHFLIVQLYVMCHLCMAYVMWHLCMRGRLCSKQSYQLPCKAHGSCGFSQPPIFYSECCLCPGFLICAMTSPAMACPHCSIGFVASGPFYTVCCIVCSYLYSQQQILSQTIVMFNFIFA